MSVDLCQGPHLRHTGQIGALKLLTVSRGVRVGWYSCYHRRELEHGKGDPFSLSPFPVLMANEGI